MKKKLEVKCPHCEKKFSYYTSTSRPFCSEKCKLIDMGGWLNESYSINGRTNSVYIENPDMLQQLIDDQDENF